MNSEQEKDLINYLGGLGFTGEQFERDLKQKIGQGTLNFRIPYAVNYGEERMLYDLRFTKDPQFDAYRMEGYHASLRQSPQVENLNINGINTARLEQSFKEFDWNKYFNGKEGKLTAEERDEAKVLLSDLWQLTSKPSEKGKEIQDILQYKYWPENNWDNGAIALDHTYMFSRTFSVSEAGCCNAALAYNILSGRLDDLYEKLSLLELDQYPGADLYGQLEQILSGTPDDFELKYQRNGPDGYFEAVIPVMLTDGYYSIGPYDAKLTPHPAIEHDVYNGVDSRELEELMRQIDWHDNRQLFIFHEDSEPEFKTKVGDIQEQLFRLSQDMVGSDIADRLQLKYWSDATFFSDTLQQTAWDMLDTLPNRQQQFRPDRAVRVACNLLSGRATISPSVQLSGDHATTWLRLDLEHKDKDGAYPEIRIAGFTKADLKAQLDMLPIPQTHYYQVYNELLRGDLVGVTLSDPRKVKIVADPEQKTVNLYTNDGRMIPVNLRLDPDWQPPTQQKQTEQQQQKQAYPKYKITRPVKRNKGKGL